MIVLCRLLLFLFFFFFSSRRRHTRLQGDWSSDVCSSDLYWVARCCRSLSAAAANQGDGGRCVTAASASRVDAVRYSARPHPGRCREHTTRRNSAQRSPAARAPRRLPERKSGRLKTSVSSNPSSATLTRSRSRRHVEFPEGKIRHPPTPPH